MVLRIAKVTVTPGREEAYLSLYRRYALVFAAQLGNRALRLLRCASPANLFFLHTWWDSSAAAERATKNPEYADLYAAMMGVLLERIEVWTTTVVQEGVRLAYPDPTVRVRGYGGETRAEAVLRAAKVTVHLGREQEQELEQISLAAHRDFLNVQEGLLTARLLRCASPANIYFAHFWWRSAEDVRRVLGDGRYTQLLDRTRDVLEERVRVYELSVVVEDPRLARPGSDAAAEGLGTVAGLIPPELPGHQEGIAG